MYDLIIVGAGTAGAVLADRLSRDGRQRVLLLDAGGYPSSPFIKIPAGFAKLFGSRFDWGYVSRHTRGGGRDIHVPRGKMLGGSANMNAQIHQWCHPEDFDGWQRGGADGWSWRHVRGVFEAQEALRSVELHGRGRAGPMKVTPLPDPHPLSRAFVEAFNRSASTRGHSYNGGEYRGAWLSEIAQLDGRRYSVFDAYLKPAMRRTNLHVVTGAEVSRVILEGGRASAVEVVEGKKSARYACSKGVILAAGAIGSPLVLLRSGIGAASELSALGIPISVDSPEVGRNLQDHPLVPVVFETKDRDTFKNAERLPSLLRYLFTRKGMLASNAVEAIAFAASSKARSSAPDIELIFTPLEWRAQGTEPPSIHAITIGAVVAKPRAQGSVSLQSSGGVQNVKIDLNLLGDKEGQDLEIMQEAVELAFQVAGRAPLAPRLRAEGTCRSPPSSTVWIHENIQTVYHPCGTCRMGSDPTAVVDASLRVRGARGLWIADASIFPTIPRGHPNAVVAMVAERAAGFVISADLESWPTAPDISRSLQRVDHVLQAL